MKTEIVSQCNSMKENRNQCERVRFPSGFGSMKIDSDTSEFGSEVGWDK